MNCAICRLGETAPGTATVTLEQDGAILVVRGVPAEVCANCGEEYIAEPVAARLLDAVARTARDGGRFALSDWREEPGP